MVLWRADIWEGSSPSSNIFSLMRTWHTLGHDWKMGCFNSTLDTLFEDLTDGTRLIYKKNPVLMSDAAQC